MKFFEKRGVALVVLALAIAGAVFIGQSRKDGFIAKKPTELLDVQYQDWICDEAGLLNGQTEQLIRDYNDSWNSKYYAITAVASIDHLTGWDAEDYAANLGEKWGLGRNDMILLLVKDGDWQVYCGDNVGYTMTDTQQNQLRQAIETTYYSGDFDSAVTAFFRQADVFYAQAKLDGGDSNDSGWYAPAAPAASSGGTSIGSVVVLIIGIFLVWMVLDAMRYSRYKRRYIVGAPVNVVRPVYYPIFWGRRYAPPRPPRAPRPPRPPHGGGPRPPYSGGPRPPMGGGGLLCLSEFHPGDRLHLSGVVPLPEPLDDLVQRLPADKVAAVTKDLRHLPLLGGGGVSLALHLADDGTGHGLHHQAVEKAQLLRRITALEIEQPPAAVAVAAVDPGLRPQVAVALGRDAHDGRPPDGIAVHGALDPPHRARQQPAHVEDLLAPPQALSGLLQAVCRHAGPFRQHLGIPLGVPGLGCVDDGFHRFPSLWNGGGPPDSWLYYIRIPPRRQGPVPPPGIFRSIPAAALIRCTITTERWTT